jgi:ATP-dependent DNA helicase RecG
LESGIGGLSGVGPRRQAALEAAGIRTQADLLFRLPIRYEDRRAACTIGALRPGMRCWVRGRVLAARLFRRRGLSALEAILADGTGRLRVVWFNQPFRGQQAAKGQDLGVFGLVERDGRGSRQLVMRSPRVEGTGPSVAAPEGQAPQAQEIVPVYERVGAVTSSVLHRIIGSLVDDLPPDLDDPLPAAARNLLGVVDLATALRQVHRPGPHLDTLALEALDLRRSPGHLRLIQEDLLRFLVSMLLRRSREDDEGQAPVCSLNDRLRSRLVAVLPFELTEGQKRVMREIAGDLGRARPMRRLLQGDVGTGKTILALLAMLIVAEHGLQVAFMAPTELLAEQHEATLARFLGPQADLLTLLTSAVLGQRRDATLARIASGQARIVVGTQALIEDVVRFRRLGLVVVDEQHRFGVAQRARLVRKGQDVHLLVMTATPIPRTLALTLHADLDVSVLDECPPGRSPVRTVWRAARARPRIVDFVRREVGQGRQIYVVYPLVEASDDMEDIQGATDMWHQWARDLEGHTVGIVHGRLPRADREATMAAFARGDLAVLVATTVIEVGVDVPNASVIIVEHAERFGLAQLHQLRGRVGRGRAASTCILVTHGRLNDVARARIDALLATNDGFVIAERDLELRGPGELLGTRQSGVPRLRVADLRRDAELLPRVREVALELLETGAVPRLWTDGPWESVD